MPSKSIKQVTVAQLDRAIRQGCEVVTSTLAAIYRRIRDADGAVVSAPVTPEEQRYVLSALAALARIRETLWREAKWRGTPGRFPALGGPEDQPAGVVRPAFSGRREVEDNDELGETMAPVAAARGPEAGQEGGAATDAA